MWRSDVRGILKTIVNLQYQLEKDVVSRLSCVDNASSQLSSTYLDTLDSSGYQWWGSGVGSVSTTVPVSPDDIPHSS